MSSQGQGGQGHGPQGQGQGGPPTLDQILWMALGTGPAKMTAWSAIGTVCVALVTSKILSDTVKYYDHYGFSQIKTAIGIALGTSLAMAHLMLTSAQTYKLARDAFPAYHTIMRFDVLANTTSDMIGGFFNFSAALFYTSQVFRLSGRKVWLFALVMFLNTGTLILTFCVAVTGFRVPEPDMVTLDKLRDFNMFRVPFFKAWGVVALLGDAAICFSMMYYLFRTKDSIVNREKRLYHKLKAAVIESMRVSHRDRHVEHRPKLTEMSRLPPVVCTFILVIALEHKTATIGDYRRAVKYTLSPLYYLSLLHSLVSRIAIRQHLDKDDESTHKDSVPLTPSTYGNGKGQSRSIPRGEMSTIHIDPRRGMDDTEEGVVIIGDVPRLPPHLEEIPCKRTFGAAVSTTALDEPILARPALKGSSSNLPKVSESDKPSFPGRGEDVPSKGTFGLVEPLPEPTRPTVPVAGLSSPRSLKSAASGRATADQYQQSKQEEQDAGVIPRWADPYYFGSLEGRATSPRKR